jgi:hypothetical protein
MDQYGSKWELPVNLKRKPVSDFKKICPAVWAMVIGQAEG